MKRLILITILFFSISAVAQEASLAGKTGKGIRKQDVLLFKKLKVNENKKWKVISFTFSSFDGKEFISFDSEGEELTSEMLDLIKSLERGQPLYFDRIIAKDENGREQRLPAMTFKII